MKRMTLVVLWLLTMTLASASSADACDCGDFLVEDASKTSASIFMGEVIDVSDPREVSIGSKSEKVYLTRFLVWERWKGAKSIEAEVLVEPLGYYTQMRVGEVYLVYAKPLALQDSSTKIEGIVNDCTRTTLMLRPGPQQKVVNPLPFYDVFKLDKYLSQRRNERPYFSGTKNRKVFVWSAAFRALTAQVILRYE